MRQHTSLLRSTSSILAVCAILLSISPVSSYNPSASPVNPPGWRLNIGGPLGSGAFGRYIHALPNGNIIVTDPLYDHEGTVDVGEVNLINGATGLTIAWIHGTQEGDHVGEYIDILSNGDFLIRSPFWANAGAANAGAVTWCDGDTGCSGEVTSSNSLVGSSTNDQVGNLESTQLSNGKYVIRAPYWDIVDTADVGAVRLCSADGSCVGVFEHSNSLHGGVIGDHVGKEVNALPNGNYVVRSSDFQYLLAGWAGAVTFCDSSTSYGCTGQVAESNSLVGGTSEDFIGSAFTLLKNGNFVVSSFTWHNAGVAQAGAATWCSKTSGCPIGHVNSVNSLVGSTAWDQVGTNITPLENGNYLVSETTWHYLGSARCGAVTWCNGDTGCHGVVDETNSLVGSTANDYVGYNIVPLSNSSYVVNSQYWNKPSPAITAAGAVSWCGSVSGCTGFISPSTSTVGGHDYDQIGNMGVYPLTGGKYVISSVNWDNDTVRDAGAVTLCNSYFSCTGPVTAFNSLVGGGEDNWVGQKILPLSNGNYVVGSFNWDNGPTQGVGAVTFCDSSDGCKGQVVGPTNSLIGSLAGDQVGFGGAIELGNGHFVVSSYIWGGAGFTSAGAVTWCSTTLGCPVGPVTADNSLVGSYYYDMVGAMVIPLSNGNYVVASWYWDNLAAATPDVGAVTLCSGSSGCFGPVSSTNSLVGSSEGDIISGTNTDPPIVELKSGNFLVFSRAWHNGPADSAGAVTLCSSWSSSGCTGSITTSNSLVGSTTDDNIGYNPATIFFTYKVLDNGHYIIYSRLWDSNPWTDAGAVSLGDGFMRTLVGPITSANSVTGTAYSGGNSIVYDYDYYHSSLVVGRPADNAITIFRNPFQEIYIPVAIR